MFLDWCAVIIDNGSDYIKSWMMYASRRELKDTLSVRPGWGSCLEKQWYLGSACSPLGECKRYTPGPLEIRMILLHKTMSLVACAQ